MTGRALTPTERGLWKTDLAAPLNFTTVAQVSGPLDDTTLAAALERLRARHPHLNERIEEGYFVTSDVPELSLRTVPGADWLEALDDELNTPLPAEGPLARFVRAGDRLLVTLHHAVGDGMSGVYLMRDWVQAANGGELHPLADPGGVDALLPARTNAMNYARFFGLELSTLLLHGKPLKLRAETRCAAYERRARVAPFELEPAFVEALSARARAEQTTVHGALSAAMVLGLLADAGVKKASVMFGCPVNLRPQLKAPVGESLGFYVSMLGFRGPVTAAEPFWQLARRVRGTLERHLATGAQHSMLRLAPVLSGWLGLDRLAPRALVDRWEKLVLTTSGLTNLGRLAIETRHGGNRIEACHFAAAPSALGNFLGTATSLNGRLFWNFIWPEPEISEPHARALTADIVSRVRAAV